MRSAHQIPVGGKAFSPAAVTMVYGTTASASISTSNAGSINLRISTMVVAGQTTVPDFMYTAHEVDVFHIQNELITEFWSFSENQAATDRIWS